MSAATLVEDGDTLVLDTGTTMLALAQKLTAKHRLTVVTNDLKIAALLDEQSDHTVILTGGVKTPEDAEKLLQENAADLIGVGRAMLADEEWTKKAMTQKREM